MTKEEMAQHLEENRGPRKEGEPQPEKQQQQEPHFTEVKNASASGLGSMGRNDQKNDDDNEKASY